MTTLKLIDPADPAWDVAVAPVTDDVHFTAGYARVHATRDARPLLAVMAEGDTRIVKPFLLRSIPDSDRHDIASLYGYGGPALAGSPYDLPTAARAFDAAFTEWAHSVGVVSEFCSFHPMLWRSETAEAQGAVEAPVRKQVVVVDLVDDVAMLAAMRADKRQNIARAQRDGLRAGVVNPGRISREIFLSLYAETMARRGATSRWRHSREYFAEYFAQFPADAHLLFAGVTGCVEAASLVLTLGATAYYHFTGNAMTNPRSGAGDLLVFEIMRWARSRGCTRLHLGGGVTSAPDDTLLAYKAGFGPGRADVRTCHRVFDGPAYESLCAVTARRLGPAYHASAFEPAYRRGDDS